MSVTTYLVGTLILGPLVTYRIWRLLAVDEITEPCRYWLSTRKGTFWAWLYKGLTCPWCFGLWLSAIVGLSVWSYSGAAGPPTTAFALWLASTMAISTLVGVIATIVERIER